MYSFLITVILVACSTPYWIIHNIVERFANQPNLDADFATYDHERNYLKPHGFRIENIFAIAIILIIAFYDMGGANG